MNDTDTKVRSKKSRIRKIGNILLFGIASLLLVYFCADWLWVMSGSNQWEMEMKKNGVTIYSLKAPGSKIKQFKGVFDTDYSLNQLVAGLVATENADGCKNSPGCIDYQIIETWSPKAMSNTMLWKVKMPGPFSPREIIVKSQVSQDKESKVIVVDVMGAPNKIPLNSGSVRVTHFHNRWIYRPLTTGGTEVTFMQDLSMGGLFPDLLLNVAGPTTIYNWLHDVLPVMLKDFRNVKYDFIEELTPSRTAGNESSGVSAL